MTPPDTHEKTEQQVNDLFDSLELTQAIDTEEFRAFLDHIPIPIIISKLVRGDQRIVYANKAYEALTGQRCHEIRGRGWSVLASFRLEDEPHLTFSDALSTCDDFMGTFKQEHPKLTLVEAYSGLIENEDAGKTYHIVALIDVTERGKAQREESARQLRDKDILLKELQHRVKNNLQLITALIRLEARNERKGNKVNLNSLAGRIEALQLLYQRPNGGGIGPSGRPRTLRQPNRIGRHAHLRGRRNSTRPQGRPRPRFPQRRDAGRSPRQRTAHQCIQVCLPWPLGRHRYGSMLAR